MATRFEIGYFVGLLVGEGHFGGDGCRPQVTLRMHVRHEAIFRWIEQTFPGGRLYGPYDHDGRRYLQWMARGAFLRDELVPLLDCHLAPELDRHSYDRFQLMKARYSQLKGKTSSRTTTTDEPPVADMGDGTPTHRPGRATRARDRHGADSRTGSSVPSTPESLADIFAELRKDWSTQPPA
jgi:hypothetical protein